MDLDEILREFKKSEPEKGTVVERKAKFKKAFEKLKKLYELDTTLYFAVPDAVEDFYDDKHSVYFRSIDTIILVGSLHLITLLHEVAHALGCDERGAVAFSLQYEKVKL